MMLIEKGGANHFNLCDTMQDTTPTEEKTEAASNRKSESYRDRISTVDQKGKRIWIYPKKPKGRLYNSRTLFSFFLLAILFAGPFIKISGQPILLLNFLERKFIIFGLAFWPQDFHLFALAMLTFIVFIVLFTAVFGRLFCGWACPQSVFMELVFRKIEYWIEGDARKQRALNEGPLTEEKVLKKGLKHAIFFAIAFLIGNTFMAYIVGIDQVKTIVSQPPWEHWSGFLAVSFFSLLFYANFAFFREQACVIVCPYGRFQSVLLDPSSIVVSYDFKRGEPRGKRSKKNPDAELGDCIDCHLCVDVCPTGASMKRADGIVLVDKHICIGCRYCMMACPFKARSFVHEPVVNQKTHAPRGQGTVESCTLCVHRVDAGGTPACVEACAATGHGAIIFGDLKDPESEISRRLAEYPSAALRPDLDLNPGVRYSNL